MDELLAKVRLPEHPASALLAIALRILLAVAIITVVALVAYLDREGYKDNATGDPIGLLDCFYADPLPGPAGGDDLGGARDQITQGLSLAFAAAATPRPSGPLRLRREGAQRAQLPQRPA